MALLYFGFFLSGFSALVYQTAWQRMLGLFAGTDAVATTIVVGAFLFGLGIGSLWGGAFADRLSDRRALRIFALCEFGIAVFALASHFLFYDLVFGELIALARSPAMVLLVVFFVLLPPTVLMGMSLPLLSKAVVSKIETASSDIAALYGVNTFGASCGALLSGYSLIGTFGYETTVYMAAALNLLVAGAAFSIASFLSRDPRLERHRATERGLRRVPRQVWFWSLMVFVSGFLIIGLEMIWFRVLGTLMQANAYAFPLILSVFLAGDALGIVYGARVVRAVRNPRRFFQWIQAGMALYALASVATLYVEIGWLGSLRELVNGSFAESTGSITVSYLVLYGKLTFLCAFPPAFLLGMSFPITQKAVQHDPDLVGELVGRIQFFNVLGNTAGAIVTGLVLLQWLGTSGTLRVIGIAGLLFVGVLFWESTRARRQGASTPGAKSGLPCAAVAALLALAIAAFPTNAAFWSRLHGTSVEEGTLVGEDRTGVVVLRHIRGAIPDLDKPVSDAYPMYIGGHVQSRVPFLMVHGALGSVGALIHPHPRSILVIGQGTGGTPYAAGVNPLTEQIRVVDIVEPVFSVMQQFTAATENPALRSLFDDPRFERVVGDGRHLLFEDQRRYDVIQADAIYPWAAQAGFLYSIEFFRQVSARLNEGGIYVQWAPTERTAADFLAVFPYVVRMNDALIGSNQPIPYAREQLALRLRGQARNYLVAAGWNPDAIFEWLTAKPEQVWGPLDPRNDDDVNTDLFPKDEYFLNRRKISFFAGKSGD